MGSIIETHSSSVSLPYLPGLFVDRSSSTTASSLYFTVVINLNNADVLKSIENQEHIKSDAHFRVPLKSDMYPNS